MVDIITELARDGELLNADDLALMSGTIERHRIHFTKWKEVLKARVER